MSLEIELRQLSIGGCDLVLQASLLQLQATQAMLERADLIGDFLGAAPERLDIRRGGLSDAAEGGPEHQNARNESAQLTSDCHLP
jgi:hypothetical protein